MEQREFTQLLSSYMNAIEQMKQRQTSGGIFTPLTAGGVTPKLIDDFNRMINMHGMQLAGMLPQMNFAEWTALSELVSSHVALMAMARNGN